MPLFFNFSEEEDFLEDFFSLILDFVVLFCLPFSGTCFSFDVVVVFASYSAAVCSREQLLLSSLEGLGALNLLRYANVGEHFTQ